MTGSLLLRGMIVGAVAGFIAFVFAYIFGEPQVDLAIAYEDKVNAAAAAASNTPVVDEPPVVTRETQAGLGLATGMIAYGAAVGGMFAIVFALAFGRLGNIGARATAALLGMAAFVSTGLIPWLKYPANPPAVGFDDTIAARTSFFFILLVASVIIMAITILIARQLWNSRGGWVASLIAGAVFVGLTALTFTALPSINEMPEGFDPLVIRNFRMATLGTHLVLWSVIAFGFGIIAERLLEHRHNRRTAAS